MYPIIKPDIGLSEILAIFKFNNNAVREFEQKFANKIGAKYAISFPYGRSGLFSILKALKINNKEILMPAYTCIVVPNAVVLSNNKPVFIDINKKNFNMELTKIKENISKNTKVIIPTHMYGYPMDIIAIRKIVGNNILIIEDACLGLLSEINNKKIGTLGDLAFFSFNISKQITTFDGGIVVTNNKEYFEKIKKYRNKKFKKAPFKKKLKILALLLASPLIYNNALYGLIQKFRNKSSFFKRKTKFENWNLNKINLPSDNFTFLTNLQAKVGLEQLKKIEEILKKRKKIENYYNKFISKQYTNKSKIHKKINHSHYNLLVKNRSRVIHLFRKQRINIGTTFNYYIPNTKKYFNSNSKFPNSKKISKKIINIPFYTNLNKKDLSKISKIINKTLKNENN